MRDHNLGDEMTRDECLRRFSEAPFVRALLSVRCLPTALPIQIRLMIDATALIDGSDADLQHAARRHDVVTLQVDGLEGTRSWVVVGSGIASVVAFDAPTGDFTAKVPLTVLVGRYR